MQLENVKGEFVLVIEQPKKESIEKPTDYDLLKELNNLLKTEEKNTAIRYLKEKYSLTKSYIYNLYEKNKTK